MQQKLNSDPISPNLEEEYSKIRLKMNPEFLQYVQELITVEKKEEINIDCDSPSKIDNKKSFKMMRAVSKQKKREM